MSAASPNLKTLCLMTATWAGDVDHFRLLAHSLSRSPLANLSHTSVVQTEDLSLFSGLPSSGSRLLSSAEVLPAPVEQRRIHAQKIQKKLGRHLTRLSGSSCRVLGWPRWPGYTGWHTQQISKLALAAQASTDYVLVIDSDVLITPSASVASILSSPEIICFSQPVSLQHFRGKTRKWIMQADQLLRAEPSDDGRYDRYFDTPFLLHVPTVKTMISWLEQHYGQPWWQTLLQQPPRRWSEFATYKLFLKMQAKRSNTLVQWRAPENMHYIFDTSNPAKLVDELRSKLADPDIHFITLHSQSSGRQRWSAHSFVESVLQLI